MLRPTHTSLSRLLFTLTLLSAGCHTTTATKTPRPTATMTVDAADLPSLWGGRIGETLSVPDASAADPTPAKSVLQQYLDWNKQS